MRVYRVEGTDGKGPYNSQTIDHVMFHDLMTFQFQDRHPAPWDDSLLNQNAMDQYGKRFDFTQAPFRFMVFGFSNLNQYRNWFYSDDALELLEELGFKLFEYEVPNEDVLVGFTQAAFLKNNSELISSRDLI